ncbi:helix-turn-helix transcriptional regulator [Spirochaeta dissipatitropha]
MTDMHVLVIIAALGAAQAAILLFLIAIRYHSRRNLPLGLFVLTFAVRVGTIPSWTPELIDAAPWVFPIAGSIPLLFGPLVWWYVRILVLERLKLPKYAVLHLLPWLIELLLLSLLVYILGQSPEPLSTLLFADPPLWWMPVRHAIKIIQGGVYALLSGTIAFGAASKQQTVTKPTRIWARVTVLLPLLSLVSFSTIATQPSAPAGGDQALFWFYLPAVLMMLTIYVFTFLSMLFPEILADNTKTAFSRPSSLDEEETGKILSRLNDKLATESYRNPDLTLAEMAKEIRIHPNRLSHVINREYGMNFSRLINQYRLEYFILQIQQGGLEHFSILRLALESGFRSKSTFNRVFHETYQMSPSDYVRTAVTGGESQQ